MLDEYDNDDLQKRTILLTLNGDLNSAIIKLEYSILTMQDIQQKAESNYNITLDKLRLFTQQGVEIYEEDLMFIKDGTLLYVSDSRDFDAYSQFSVYQIIKTLGEGGFGKVMLGRHKLTQEQVAIKIIDTGKFWNAADIDLVFREAEVMKSLRHKNIIKIYNCYTLPSMQVVLIMEFLEGGDLVDYIQQKGRISEEEAKIIFRQIAEAICYCHDQKLIHRDLKLENILLTSKTDKQVKIIDFGIATVATNFIIDKIDVGSLSYMPPEIISGQVLQIRPSIDIWAMGVILFALVCGSLPFTRNVQEQTIQNILRLNYQFPNITLSKEYKDLVTNMLNPDPNERYSGYQILGHPWLRRNTTTLQAPNKLFPKSIIKRDYTKVSGGTKQKSSMLSSVAVIQRDFTSVGKSNTLESPTVIVRSPSSIRPFENAQIVEEEKVIPKSPLQRKLSNFNQKLIDRIFKEDKVKKKQTPRTQLNSPKDSKHSIDKSLLSTRFHSKQSSEDFTKRIHSKQIKLRTIISLSHLTDLKVMYNDEMKKKYKQNHVVTEQNDQMNMYKLQLSFRHRKMKSDQLCMKTFRSSELKISDLYSTLFKC